MDKCQKIRLLFLEKEDGTLSPRSRRRLERHLETCGACASEFASMEETVRIMKTRTRPDPGREFWDGYWGRLAGKLDADPAEPSQTEVLPRRGFASSVFGRIPRWSYAAAAGLIILFVGIRIGQRIAPEGRIPASADWPATGSISGNPILAGQIKNYFNRSKIILLALSNFDSAAEDPYALNLSYQKQISRELVLRGRALESRLTGAGGRRYRDLIGDLKTVLTQVSNLDTEDNVQAIDIVRNGIRLRGILFKISISEMSLSGETTSRTIPAESRTSNRKGDRT